MYSIAPVNALTKAASSGMIDVCRSEVTLRSQSTGLHRTIVHGTGLDDALDSRVYYPVMEILDSPLT